MLLEHMSCKVQINIKTKTTKTYTIMSYNRTYNSIFVFYVAHTSSDTEKSTHQGDCPKNPNVFTEKCEMKK